MAERIKQGIEIESQQIINEIFGDFDENIEIIKSELNINVKVSNNEIQIFGEPIAVEMGIKLMYSLKEIVKDRKRLDKQDLRYAIQQVVEGNDGDLKDLLKDVVCVTSSGKSIKPKTFGQKRYIDSIRNNDIVFGIGPAGTGKTYLAMAMAVQAFKNKEVNRIVLTRPAVEAGENLGFLPGDLQEKVDPYLRPEIGRASCRERV